MEAGEEGERAGAVMDGGRNVECLGHVDHPASLADAAVPGGVDHAVVAGAFWFHLKSQVVTLDPRPDSEVEMTTVENGTTYKLHQGNLYRVLPRSGKWEFVKQYYDTHFYASNVSVIPRPCLKTCRLAKLEG